MLSVLVLFGVLLLPRISPVSAALGVGTGGALVDVSSYLRANDGVERRWGQDDDFYAVSPGTFSFALDNADGRFTPDNPGSALVTRLSEGAAASLQVGSRIVGGTVRTIEPQFPGDDAAWACVRVTCEDALGELARTEVVSATQAAALKLGATAFWPFSDPDGSTEFASVTDGGQPFLLDDANIKVSYGVSGTAPGGGSQTTFFVSGASAVQAKFRPYSVPGRDVQYPASNAVGVWLTPRNRDSLFQVRAFLGTTGTDRTLVDFGFVDGDLYADGGLYTLPAADVVVDRAYYFAAEYDSGTGNVSYYVDNVLVSTTAATIFTGVTQEINITVGTATPTFDTDISMADLYFGPDIVDITGYRTGDVRDRLGAYSRMTPVPFDTIPAALSNSKMTPIEGDGVFLLDAINNALESERGYLYPVTTGTLTSPTTKVTVRERTRPVAVDYTFDVETELKGSPKFVRDVTNLVSRVTVNSAAGNTTVTDSTLTARAGNASDTANIGLLFDEDRRYWGQDRLARGSNTLFEIASVAVDAMTTPTDRSADLLALKPGDRVQFTGLPSTVLGFTTYDGWFLGAQERHTLEEHTFELYLAPALVDSAIFDTSRFMASGGLTLSGNINAAVTSIVFASTKALLSTTEVPYTIQLDNEQMTVTAVVGATSPQTATVVRGANGSTAASHTSGAVVVSVPQSLFTF
jgi:hypothetical protein